MDPESVAAFDLQAYLRRIGLADASPSDLVADNYKTLERLMVAQSLAIPFENLNVVVGLPVSMAPADVEHKLVAGQRGGYCFELNTLLRLALLSLGFTRVEPTLCRVRWNKPPDPMPAPSHIILRVWCADGARYLADVGFAGPGAPVPVRLDTAEAQQLPYGLFRIAPCDTAGCTTALERCDSQGLWRACYIFDPDVTPVQADMELCNFGASSLPGARFTTQLFAHIAVGDGTHHILNNSYAITRRGATGKHEKEIREIATTDELLGLLRDVFKIDPPDGPKDIDRFMPWHGKGARE